MDKSNDADYATAEFLTENAGSTALEIMSTFRTLIEKKLPDHGIDVKNLVMAVWMDGYNVCRQQFLDAAKPLQRDPRFK